MSNIMLSRTVTYINHRVLPKSCITSQKMFRRSMCITHRVGNTIFKLNSSNKISRYSPVLCASFTRRYISNDGAPLVNSNNIEINSTTATESIVENIPADVTPTNLLSNIPDAPLPPVPEVLDLAAPLAEPTFASLGLGGWWPIGIAQQCLELIHVSCGMPWWATITIGTICVRSLLFPLVLMQQRSATVLSNTLPGMQKIQNRISEARTCGDQYEVARSTQELLEYMKKYNCSPFKSMIVPMVQAPIFISFFFGLKRMTNLPVESMTQGGILWFTNLTASDPYFLLPVLTSASMALTIRLGIDAPRLATMGLFRYVIQGLPLIILPFTLNFPSAITWYWLSTNIISMIQVSILRLPKVRAYFKLPVTIVHPPNAIEKPKSFKEGFKSSMRNMKIAREMADRQQLDCVQFNKAGRGPIPKTYSYNPTQDKLKISQAVGKKT
ncbi:hypothetical protein PV327_006073 [Microctonus hyperodae]|uniref:Membrane insertase YidC/Oxa/ALB C-terminal domain-containing protein n=1 Tax=Microctonus hyperodae TaxID=165561 RepID=A0AA39L0E6_MICHY|nr:hypothetical protein PV327_006073 [Microctonus hyperodae]